MYRCESWTMKKAKHWRTDAFKLWCWRRFLRVPWKARRSNQSILKEINPEYSLEGLMLKLKLQYFGCLIWTSWLIGNDPDAGKDWRQKEKRATENEIVKMASLIQRTRTWANSGRWWGTGKPGVLQSMGSPRVGHDLATEQQEHKTTDNWKELAAPSKGSYQEEKSREVST